MIVHLTYITYFVSCITGLPSQHDGSVVSFIGMVYDMICMFCCVPPPPLDLEAVVLHRVFAENVFNNLSGESRKRNTGCIHICTLVVVGKGLRSEISRQTSWFIPMRETDGIGCAPYRIIRFIRHLTRYTIYGKYDVTTEIDPDGQGTAVILKLPPSAITLRIPK